VSIGVDLRNSEINSRVLVSRPETETIPAKASLACRGIKVRDNSKRLFKNRMGLNPSCFV